MGYRDTAEKQHGQLQKAKALLKDIAAYGLSGSTLLLIHELLKELDE